MRDTNWGSEDPIRRLARLVAFTAGVMLLLLGYLTRDAAAIGGGTTLLIVAMAAQEPPPPVA
jgi:uncharacterized membrane protein YphA (DoxX/SURF4 family)